MGDIKTGRCRATKRRFTTLNRNGDKKHKSCDYIFHIDEFIFLKRQNKTGKHQHARKSPDSRAIPGG